MVDMAGWEEEMVEEDLAVSVKSIRLVSSLHSSCHSSGGLFSLQECGQNKFCL